MKENDAGKLLSILVAMNEDDSVKDGEEGAKVADRRAADQNGDESGDGDPEGATQRLQSFLKEFNGNVPDPIVSSCAQTARTRFFFFLVKLVIIRVEY